MTQIANTLQTYDTVGIREDLSDTISRIDPTATPYMSGIGRAEAENTLFEWQQDALAAPDGANAHVEGDVTSFQALPPTVRVQNRTQISKKAVSVSGTDEKVKKAGRASQMAFEMAKKSIELKRDMETILLSNQGAQAGDNSVTPRKTAGLPAWLKSNVDHEGTGVNPVYTSLPSVARTDGVVRPFAESQVKSIMQTCFSNGARPRRMLVSPVNKGVASGFAGIATKYKNVTGNKATIVATADVYVSDFGELTIEPSLFQRGRDVWLLDNSMAKLAFLRPFFTENLAKTGDSAQKHIVVEYGHKVINEKGLALITDTEG